MIIVAIMVSIGVYAGIGMVLVGRVAPDPQQTSARNVLYGVAVLLALVSIWLRRALLAPARLERTGAERGSPGVARHLLNATLLSAALGEAVALIGLMLTIITGDSTEVLRLGVVALAMVLLGYPRRAAWERAVQFYASANGGRRL